MYSLVVASCKAQPTCVIMSNLIWTFNFRFRDFKHLVVFGFNVNDMNWCGNLIFILTLDDFWSEAVLVVVFSYFIVAFFAFSICCYLLFLNVSFYGGFLLYLSIWNKNWMICDKSLITVMITLYITISTAT